MDKATESAWTVLRLLNWTRDFLATGRVEDPRLAGEVLLAHVLKCDRVQLYTRFAYEPTADELAEFRGLVRRAKDHEPVAYLVGAKEFYSLRLKITPDVLVPRPETETLASEAISHLRGGSLPRRLWDACTGSGCVAIAVAAQMADLEVLATDISAPAVAVAGENAAAHGLADRVRCRQADLLALPDDCRDMAPFGAITANPPYVADNQMISETVKHEPSVAVHGGADGLDFIRRVVADAPPHIAAGGALIMEFGFAQADDVRDLLLATGCFAEPRIISDLQGIERALVAIRR